MFAYINSSIHTDDRPGTAVYRLTFDRPETPFFSLRFEVTLEEIQQLRDACNEVLNPPKPEPVSYGDRRP